MLSRIGSCGQQACQVFSQGTNPFSSIAPCVFAYRFTALSHRWRIAFGLRLFKLKKNASAATVTATAGGTNSGAAAAINSVPKGPKGRLKRMAPVEKAKAEALKYIHSPSRGRDVLLPTPEARERHALRMLYERCNGANWPGRKNENWCDPDKPLSQWEGVEVQHGRVVELSVGPCYDAFEGVFPLELEWLTHLQKLSLRGNDLGAAGAKTLRPALGKLTNLTTLHLRENDLGAAGAKALAPALRELMNLTELNLGWNKLGAAGAQALCPALEKLANLEILYLSANDLGADGAKALCPALEKLANLTFLYLDSNNFGDAGAKALCPALEKLSKLKFLHFDRNKIGDAGAEALCPALSKLANLTELWLDGNDFGAAGAAALRSALEKLTNLKKLHLFDNDIVNVVATQDNDIFNFVTTRDNDIGADGEEALQLIAERIS